MSLLIVKTGKELSVAEIKQINKAKTREFKTPPLDKEQLVQTLFFLLLDNNKILAMGELIPIEPVSFNGELFSIFGFGGIVANEKDKGYGREIMTAIKDHLSKVDKTGVGFCAIRNKGFYEKCGFNVNSYIIKRFVFKKGKETITNKEDDCVIFYEGSDSFIRKASSIPDQEILLPRKPDW